MCSDPRDDSGWWAFSQRTLHNIPLRIIAFRRFHRNVTQQELDLLQLSACRVAQARAGPTTIVGRELLNSSTLCTGSHNVPDDLFGDAVAPNRALAAHAPKDSPIPDACRLSPFVDCCLDPIGDRHSTDMPALAHQIDQGPVFLPLLDIAKLELGNLGPAQTAAEKNGKDRPIAPALQASVRPAPATGSCTDPRSANFPSAHRVSLRL